MNKLNYKSTLSICIISAFAMTGCATSTLLKKDNGVRTRNVQTVLVNDTVLAFGKPSQAISALPSDSIVIAGQKNSYVITSGGARFVKVITGLDPKFIQIDKALTFNSEKNDGHFSGILPLKYVKLSEDVTKQDRAFFIENGAEECTTSSDQRLKAQRFCFNITLSGLVYPSASNISSLKALSKPYQVSIYTTQEVKDYSKAGSKTADKLMLFPFAVAFDVVTLPFQALHKIFD
ncbi:MULTISPECIES: hypothetical protein [Acinetobacter]|uniref:hypothetical protein n=1 Tax=Acinetobacter TaxID=469 RepID=UPI00141AA268|nr:MULTISPECIES: hypothetical protein [Acinetobacter]MCS4297168.1 uncharacterized protein YceK [Acinetobacter guillouiae]MCW2250151.1 uncharacterized protein YceK [Acinetobacter sp. BIGb0204]NII39255.1 uncharacterized protein YceK [Acinetobacter sp. BIGb0196]